MREDLLHFIWQYKKLPLRDLMTTKNENVVILDVGNHNHLAGPDFFNAKIEIAGQLWAGNVELHLKASDWYVHHHESDPNYDNVILHVVWEDDGAVFRRDNSEIPTLELQPYISKSLLEAYNNLFDNKKKTFINCEKDIDKVDTFLLQNWLERVYFERLESKSAFIFASLERSKNDWEQVFFTLLLKNFGSKVNGEAFLSLANGLKFSIIRKLHPYPILLESLFLGMSHLLEDDRVYDAYYGQLKREYLHLAKKFDLNGEAVQKPAFFKLRPHNFPTIRLSQLANLYHADPNLYDNIIQASTLPELYSLFDVSASTYWNDHFTFGKTSGSGSKKVSREFMDLLVINTVLPIKFCHAKHVGKDNNEQIVAILSEVGSEHNGIVQKFGELGISITSARESQAVLQLYNEYCTKNKCLRCAIGNRLLRA